MNTNRSFMDQVKAFTARNQMAIFILLTLLISWASIIPAQGGLLP